MSFWGAVTLRKKLQHMLLHPDWRGAIAVDSLNEEELPQIL
jgi:hypothetical protein